MNRKNEMRMRGRNEDDDDDDDDDAKKMRFYFGFHLGRVMMWCSDSVTDLNENEMRIWVDIFSRHSHQLVSHIVFTALKTFLKLLHLKFIPPKNSSIIFITHLDHHLQHLLPLNLISFPSTHFKITLLYFILRYSIQLNSTQLN